MKSMLIFIMLILVPIAQAAEENNKTTQGQEAQVVAEVNGTKITLQEVEQALDRQLKNGRSQLKDEQLHALRSQLLGRLIERELFYQAAAGKELIPSDEVAEEFITQFKKRFPDDSQFQEMLKNNQITEKEFRLGFKKDMAVKNYITSDVLKSIVVVDSELKKDYDENPDKYAMPEQVRARHILFKVAEGADDKKVAEAKKKAEAVLAEAKKEGADFDALAKKHSEGPTKARGGDLGYFTKNQMVPPFADAAFSTPKGKVTGLVRTMFGFHIIKVEDKKDAGVQPFEEVKERVRQQLLGGKQQAAFASHLKKLKEKAKIIVYMK